MSKAKDEYYKFKKPADDHFGGLSPEINNYVEELEAEKAELLKLKGMS